VILVDSSVWIAAWRGDGSAANTLSRLIEGGDAVINPLIRTELLQGARDRRHQQELKGLLTPITVLPLPESLWNKAPEIYLQSRERGTTLTTIDCLIATHARIERIMLWSLDQALSKVPGVRALNP